MGKISLLLLLVSALPVAADDYLLVFAADSNPYTPGKTHTFAAVARVESMPGCPPRVLDFQSLSWLPATGKVRGFAIRAEKGRNVPLNETIQDCMTSGCRICVWGPYRIQTEMADQFRCRIATVETCFKYKGACLISPRSVCDCARSLEELVGQRRYIGLFGYGAAAGSSIVQKYAPWLINPEETHPWVVPLLGLAEYPLVYRQFGDFTSRLDQMNSWIRKQ